MALAGAYQVAVPTWYNAQLCPAGGAEIQKTSQIHSKPIQHPSGVGSSLITVTSCGDGGEFKVRFTQAMAEEMTWKFDLFQSWKFEVGMKLE